MTTREYNRLVDSSADGLMRFVVFNVGDRDVARDIVQESYARLWERRCRVEDSTARGYLFTVAYNLSMTFHRERGRFVEEGVVGVMGVVEGGYDNTYQIMWQELGALEIEAKTLIILRDWEGYSYREIGAIMELGESAVKVGLYRARRVLRARLEKVGVFGL